MEDLKQLEKIVTRFDKISILTIGDLILDRLITGNVSRISPEAPVPVVDFISETYKLGGAANTISNIWTLGGKIIAIGVIGDDVSGRKLLKLLNTKGINTDGIIIVKDRLTSVKTRIIAAQQQIVRIDREKRDGIDHQYTGDMLKYIKSMIKDVDAILISDYDKGVITKKLLDEIIPLSQKMNKPIIVDPKDVNFLNYSGVTVVTPNLNEASFAARIRPTDEISIKKIGKWLLKRLKCKAVLITRGKDGMTLFKKNGDIIHIPTVAKEVFDVTGAGDTVAGVVSLSLASGATMTEAAMIANTAAGLVVGKLGTAAVTRDELLSRLGR